MNSYLKGMLDGQSEDFKNGVIEGIRMYAVWKDGTQIVGCLEKNLKDVIEDIEEVFKSVGGIR